MPELNFGCRDGKENTRRMVEGVGNKQQTTSETDGAERESGGCIHGHGEECAMWSSRSCGCCCHVLKLIKPKLRFKCEDRIEETRKLTEAKAPKTIVDLNGEGSAKEKRPAGEMEKHISEGYDAGKGRM